MAEIDIENGRIVIKTKEGRTIRTDGRVHPDMGDLSLLREIKGAIDYCAGRIKGETRFEIEEAEIPLEAIRNRAGIRRPPMKLSFRLHLSGETLRIMGPMGPERKIEELARVHLTDYDMARSQLESSGEKQAKGGEEIFLLWTEQKDAIKSMRERGGYVPADYDLAYRIISALDEAAGKVGIIASEERWFEIEGMRIPFESIAKSVRKSVAERQGKVVPKEKIRAKFHVKNGTLFVSIGGGRPIRTGMKVELGMSTSKLDERMIYALAEIGLKAKGLEEKERIAMVEITQEDLDDVFLQLVGTGPEYYVANSAVDEFEKKKGTSYLIYELTPSLVRKVQDLDDSIQQSKGMERAGLMREKERLLKDHPSRWTMPLKRRFFVGDGIPRSQYEKLPLRVHAQKKKPLPVR